MHRMRWPSLFICCGGDQLSPAGKYLSSCHSETSPQTGRGNPHFLAVDAQVPSSEWERQRVCCCVNSSYVPYRMKLLKAKEVQKPSVSGGSFAYFSSCWEKWAVGDIKKKLLGTATRRRQNRNRCRKGSNRRHFSSIAPTGQLSAASCAAARYSCGTGSVMACADSPGRMLNTSGHTPGHRPHWIQVSRWTYACIFLPPFAKQIGNIMPANRGN